MDEPTPLPVLEYLRRLLAGTLRSTDTTHLRYPTAHSTIIEPGQSFTSIDLKATCLRPAWAGTLTATARASHSGRTISHYSCDIARDDGTTNATVTSAVMTLTGEGARGR